MNFLSLIGLAVALLMLLGIILILVFTKGPSTDETTLLKSEFKSNDEGPKTYLEMTEDERIESHKEYLRIENDHSLEKKYIRFCLDELAQYPSEYVLTLRESEPLPDYSEKGMESIPSFRKLCDKVKDLAKLDDCAYVDPKICTLPFHVNNLEGGCDSFSEICDGSEEPYLSFWLKKYIV